MDQQVKEKWVAALRSGRYEQAHGKLRAAWGEKEGYCCLGVLCEVAIEEGLEVRTMTYTEDVWAEGVNHEGVVTRYSTENWGTVPQDPVWEGAYLPLGVMQWAGLSEPDPTVRGMNVDYPDDENTLAGLNDSGLSFERIADIIEQNL
jgi:hypothetical protein